MTLPADLLDADVPDLHPLFASIARGPLGVEDVRRRLRGPNRIVAVRRDPLAICELTYYNMGGSGPYPFSGLVTQVSALLPMDAGLFTDGTMPKLLAWALRRTLTGLPAAAQLLPVWALLETPTRDKYFAAFQALTATLPIARRVRQFGAQGIWMPRLGDARAAVAAV